MDAYYETTVGLVLQLQAFTNQIRTQGLPESQMSETLLEKAKLLKTVLGETRSLKGTWETERASMDEKRRAVEQDLELQTDETTSLKNEVAKLRATLRVSEDKHDADLGKLRVTEEQVAQLHKDAAKKLLNDACANTRFIAQEETIRELTALDGKHEKRRQSAYEMLYKYHEQRLGNVVQTQKEHGNDIKKLSSNAANLRAIEDRLERFPDLVAREFIQALGSKAFSGAIAKALPQQFAAEFHVMYNSDAQSLLEELRRFLVAHLSSSDPDSLFARLTDLSDETSLVSVILQAANMRNRVTIPPSVPRVAARAPGLRGMDVPHWSSNSTAKVENWRREELTSSRSRHLVRSPETSPERGAARVTQVDAWRAESRPYVHESDDFDQDSLYRQPTPEARPSKRPRLEPMHVYIGEFGDQQALEAAWLGEHTTRQLAVKATKSIRTNNTLRNRTVPTICFWTQAVDKK